MLPSGGFDQRSVLFKQGLPVKNGINPIATTATVTDMNCEEVRTLFVSGLPMDVRLRELYLLFRCYDGYEGSFLKLISSKPGKPPQPIAFVSFKSRSLAERALEELQGVKFDPASSQTLRLEFARTNSRVSPKQQQTQVQQQPPTPHLTSPPIQPPLVMPPQGNPPVYFQAYTPGANKDGMYGFYYMPTPLTAMAAPSNTPAINNETQHSLYGMMGNSGWPHRMLPMNYQQGLSHVSTPSPTVSPAPSTPHLSFLNMLSDSDSSYNSPSHTPTQALENYYHSIHPSESYSERMHATSSPVPSDSMGYSTQLMNLAAPGSLPCSTLFVANLDSNCTEEEIKQLFGSCAGFIKAKLFARGSPPVAFVDFSDIDCATGAMEKLQGHPLPSSKRSSGIRIEYARQRMGEPQAKSPISQEDLTENTSPIQSITNSTANLLINQSSTSGLPSSTIIPSIASAASVGNQVHADLNEQTFQLNLQQQVPLSVSIPSVTSDPDPYSQHNNSILPTFPNQQGIDPMAPSFASLPRHSPVQSISSLVTQNYSASTGNSPQRLDYGPFPTSVNNRLMYGQGYTGMSRYPGMVQPGSVSMNPQGQLYVNGFVQGLPQPWPFKNGFQHQN